jgi:hypothetical protein
VNHLYETLNRQKSDRVPSEVMLSGAQTRIQDWWAQAYDGVLGERFRLEAQASLPLVGGGAGVEEVYAGVRVRSTLAQWVGIGGVQCLQTSSYSVNFLKNFLYFFCRVSRAAIYTP